jgi:hypothetical protein
MQPAPRPAIRRKIMNTPAYSIDKRFWKRLGMAGFAFFLVKGLVWLAVPVVMVLLGGAN